MTASIRRERRRLDVAMWKAERQMMRSVGRVGMSTVPLLWLVGGILGVIVGGLAVFATVNYVQQQTEAVVMDARLLAVMGWWCVAVTVPGVVGAVAVQTSRRMRQREAVGAQVAGILTGFASKDVATLVDWLDAYWCAAYPTTHVPYAFDHQHIMGQVNRFPTLIDLSPTPWTSKYPAYRARVEILLAVDWLEAAPLPSASRLTQRVEFVVEVTSAGIRAVATADFVKRIERAPKTSVVVAEVAAELAVAALRYGGVPPSDNAFASVGVS